MTMTLTLYAHTGPGGTLSGTLTVDPYGPIPPNVTTVAPPTYTPPQIPARRGGEWVVLDEMPDEPAPVVPTVPTPPAPVLSRQDFARLFSTQQLLRLELVMAQAAALSAADIEAALAGTAPVLTQRLLVTRVAYRRLETADSVDLGRQDTIAYLATLRALGVIESDAEATRILTGRNVA